MKPLIVTGAPSVLGLLGQQLLDGLVRVHDEGLLQSTTSS